MIVSVLILLGGLVIYAGYGLPGLAYLMGATCLSYFVGLALPRRRWLAAPFVILNALVLVFLKLQPVTGVGLFSVLGISYFTLQIISYTVDVARGKYGPERSFLRYALYVTYFPHLFTGPIERYDVMLPCLLHRRPLSWNALADGGTRILWGALKKLVIANRLSVIIGAIGADTAQYSGSFALLAVLLYSVQLYCDFSGAIDMVLGVSHVLGLSMSENFDTPFLSRSVQEFWRRWHITLGAWLREYVYIPLGGNRKGTVRRIVNLLITFLVSGLWHGVHYLLWGLGHGIFTAFGSRLQTRFRTLDRVITFLIVSLLWAFFVWPSWTTALQMLGSIFTTFNYAQIPAAVAQMGLTLGDWIVLAVAVAAVCAFDLNRQRVKERLSRLRPAAKTAVLAVLGLVVLTFGMYGLGFNATDFIYSRF